jgi:hypothetical protein
MSHAAISESVDALHRRVLAEGYGPGAWHGPDLKAAIADVTPALAYRRPAPGRHNIVEVVLHHAFFVRSVRAQITGSDPGKFVLDGEEWFVVDDASTLAWPGRRRWKSSSRSWWMLSTPLPRGRRARRWRPWTGSTWSSASPATPSTTRARFSCSSV